MYIRKRPKNTRYQYLETRKTAEALVLLNELNKDDEPQQGFLWIEKIVGAIVKFCCYMCGVEYDEK